MNLFDIVAPMTVDEAKATKTRLDPKCWKGKHKEGTKVKGGVRVNNCVPNESVKEDNFHGSQDDWHAGDNAWSSENHEMFEGHSFSNGDQVELKPEYADRAGEVYTVSQCDSERGRCWIGDADGRGWYARFDQLIPSVGQEELDEFAPGPERDDDEVPDQILTLANRWWNATDDQPKITNVLRSLGWSIAQVESEDDAVQMQHDDGTTYFISADDFDPDVFEGWSNKMLARRTGQLPTPYSVYIKGEKWRDFADDDHAENVANKLRAKFEREGRDPSVITIAATNKDIKETEVDEHIGKVKDGYRLYSSKGKNLGTFPSKAGAEKHEREVQYFKHADESVEQDPNAPYTPSPAKPFRNPPGFNKQGTGLGNKLAQQNRYELERNTPVKTSAEYINRQANTKPGEPIPPPFGTKIQVKKNKGVAEMDKSQKGPAGWNIDDYDYTKGKWTQGKTMTAKDAVKDMHKELNKAFNTEPESKKPVKETDPCWKNYKQVGMKTKNGKQVPNCVPVKESYWTRLQNERNTKLNSLVNELKESIKK